MITEDDLRESLRALERLAPDPGAVAARITAGVRARHRRRNAVVVAAAAGTAVAVAVPAALLGGSGSGPTAAAPTGPALPASTPPAGLSATPSATAPPTRAPEPAATARLTPLTVPFTVGWLPAGWHPVGVESSPGLALRSYESARETDTLVVALWDDRVLSRPQFDGPEDRRQLSRHVALVVRGTPDAAVRARVLSSVTVVRPTSVTFAFQLAWVPAGYRPVASQSASNHWVGTRTGSRRVDPASLDSQLILDPRPAVPDTEAGALTVDVSTEDGSQQDKGLTPDGTFLGHPSLYTADDVGSRTLHLFGVNGMHVAVIADTRGRPELTRSALERLVAGLRLVPTPADQATWAADPLP